MTDVRRKRGRLAAAERFAALRILEARLVQVGTERTLDAESRKKAEIEVELEAVEGYQRALAGGEVRLSAAHLEQAVLYRAWVTERLDAQAATAADARRAHEASLDRTRDCVRERSAFERAARRSEEQAEVEEAQREQKLLDAHANMKLAAALVRGRVKTGEDDGN